MRLRNLKKKTEPKTKHQAILLDLATYEHHAEQLEVSLYRATERVVTMDADAGGNHDQR